MDPTANLAEQRRIIARIQREQDAVPDDTAPTTDQLIGWAGDLHRLAELAQALDEWITRGGFLPASWQHEHRR